MSDISTDPNAQQIDAPEPDNGVPAEPTAIHPAWETALAVVPESLRAGIYQQIRTSESESQKAIEAARQNSIDPSWREFAEAAKAASINPDELVNAYNVAQQLTADPLGFQAKLNAEIDQAVRSGQLTRAEGASAKAEVQGRVDEELDDLETPEAKQIRELQAQIEGINGNLSAQQQQAEQQRIEQASNDYYDEFQQTVDDAFSEIGYPNVQPQTKIAVMRMADSALNGDITDSLTLQQAVKGAVNSLLAFRDQQTGGAPAPVAQQQQRLPIGGGSGAPAQPAPQKFDNTLAGRKARQEAMIAEGQRYLSQG